MGKKSRIFRKTVTLEIAILILIFAFGFWVGMKYEKLEFVRVIDGDTFVVKNRRDGQEWRVRLWGVNAPDQKECFFDDARKILSQELKNKNIIYQRYGYDGYGRILAEVYLDGESLEEKMVATGAARVYDGAGVHDDLKPSDEFIKNLRKLEERAKAEKMGVWSDGCMGR